MKWFKLGFVLFGFIGSVANANDTFAPPVKLTPQLEKQFLQVESRIINNNISMFTNVNRVKAGLNQFFDQKMMKSLRYLTQEVRKVEKGNYNQALLDTMRATGKGMIGNAEELQVWLNHYRTRNNLTTQQYNDIYQKIQDMGGFGVYIYNTSLRTLKKYY
ncbi:hypothetical protein B0187_09080 [Haemophilus paracuniculus]|uniref:Uncharacterized protein n=1 Tax=Haemophilus paracuniculus TaxID=734 RepID=A0A1T0AQR3_9PAST|nr:hypothetical protein [Haemophilus paracuniculus]OOR98233.1 hypothetical protein B0187_09080 [Haemophilus paracuniculus]